MRHVLRSALILSFFALLAGSPFAFGQSPTITSVSPTSVSPGGQITITGMNLGSAAGSVAVVNVSGYNCTMSNWSAMQMVATVPGNAATLQATSVSAWTHSIIAWYDGVVRRRDSQPQWLRPRRCAVRNRLRQ